MPANAPTKIEKTAKISLVWQQMQTVLPQISAKMQRFVNKFVFLQP